MAAETGVIILGNSGAGKSFLANVLLGKEKFEHKLAPSAVTLKTESDTTFVDGKKITVFNIPGLVEAEQQAIERNKREIEKAFLLHPNSIILFVLGHIGGRIIDQDFVAFKALDEAYHFNRKSLCFIVNNLPECTPDYCHATRGLISKILLIAPQVLRVELYPTVSTEKQKNEIRAALFAVVKTQTASVHRQYSKINLTHDKVEHLRQEVKTEQQKLSTMVDNLINVGITVLGATLVLGYVMLRVS